MSFDNKKKTPYLLVLEKNTHKKLMKLSKKKGMTFKSLILDSIEKQHKINIL